jgi:hypothetical protein
VEVLRIWEPRRRAGRRPPLWREQTLVDNAIASPSLAVGVRRARRDRVPPTITGDDVARAADELRPVAIFWSLALGIIIALIGLIAFGDLARGRWY